MSWEKKTLKERIPLNKINREKLESLTPEQHLHLISSALTISNRDGSISHDHLVTWVNKFISINERKAMEKS